MLDPQMVPDTGTLTTLLNRFTTVFSLGFERLGPESKWILTTLVAIELIFSGLAWAAKGQDVHLSLVKKLLPIGFITLLVTTWKSVVTMVLGGFIWVGMTAGGGTSDYLNDPSAIIDIGMNVCQPIIDFLNNYETFNPAKALMMAILLGSAMIGILVCFFIIAINCFVTYIEFYLISVLTAIFVPFGVFKPTAFLSEKAIGGVLAQGVKLMVLAFIIAVSAPVVASIQLPAEPTIAQCWLTLLAVGAIMMLVIHAPALAGGIMSGSPSLSAGAAAATTIGAMAGMGAAGGAAIGAGKAALSAGSSAAGAAARLTGAVSTAGSAGAAASASNGVGRVGQALGAAGNVAGMAANKGLDAVKTGASNAAAPLKNSFQQGKNDAMNFAPIKPGAAGGSAGAGAASSAPGAEQAASPAAAASGAADGAAGGEAGGSSPSGGGEAQAASGEAGASSSAPPADNGTATSPAPPGPSPSPSPAPAPAPAKPAAAPPGKNAGGQAVKAVETLKQGDAGGGNMAPSLHHGED